MAVIDLYQRLDLDRIHWLNNGLIIYSRPASGGRQIRPLVHGLATAHNHGGGDRRTVEPFVRYSARFVRRI